VGKAYYTSNDIIASVKRKISLPISQNTFTGDDILAFANEEMFIAQVPSVLQFHEEYFVTYKTTPLQTNVSRYAIPDRATGMKLRDLFWMDINGNLFEMTRIDEHDKAFFQRNVGANQAIHKFYVEGNYVVLTPGVVDSPTGSLVFVFFLRPNQLVKDDKASTIQYFTQTTKINNSLISPLDTYTIGSTYFTAVNTLGGTITAVSALTTISSLVTSVAHQLTTGQTITIAGSNTNPSVNGTYIVTVNSADTFTIPIQIATAGTTGTFTCVNQFQIGASDALTAASLAASVSAAGNILSATSSSDTVTLGFSDIYTTLTTTNTIGFVIPTTTIGIKFNTLPSTYTDSETNTTSTLFTNGGVIDFLQTNPGHQTYVYDVTIPANGISGTAILFNQSQLLVPSGTANNSSSTSNTTLQYILAPLKVGDYICLANEAIIPQIPPDLHNGLAERTAARILAALGDQQGLQASLQKIAEIELKQGNLLDNRSEGTPQKVVGRHSLLRYGKFGTIRRV
jgi:hypothetical protein